MSLSRSTITPQVRGVAEITPNSPISRQKLASHVERQNLTVRMQMRRLTRLTDAFSKKWENLWAAYCLHFAYYNFCRIHKTLRVTPSIEAGIVGTVWTAARTPGGRVIELRPIPPPPWALRRKCYEPNDVSTGGADMTQRYE